MSSHASTAYERTFGHKPAVCPICSSSEHSFVRAVFDDRYGCPDPFSIVRCVTCGHFMTSPSLAEEELGALYSTYYPRKQAEAAEIISAAANVRGAMARIRRWLSGTDNQGQYCARVGEMMLDLGCGNGQSLLEAENLGSRAYGVEADPNVRRMADELGLRVHIGSIHDRPFPELSFDLIVLNQVIEHIPEPGMALEALKHRLKPGGRIVLVFPNRDSFWQRLSSSRWINWHIPYHLHHFNADGFGKLVRRHGFTVLRKRTITPNVWTVLQLRALRETSKIGVPSAIWSSLPRPNATENSTTVSFPARALHGILRRMAFSASALLNRTVDLCGYGDSLLVVLAIGTEP